MTGFPHGIHRVLVVKPSSLGDILHIFPALEAIHRVCPAAKLDFLIAPAFAPLLRYSPWPVERTILFERRRLGALFSCVPETLRLIRNLRRERYDLVIDFQGLLRSAFFAAWARSPIHAGFAAPRERAAAWFYSRRIGVPAAASHAVERALALARGLFPEAGERIPEPELPVDPDGLAEIAGLPEPVIALLPGARWESKTFPASLFAAVAEAVQCGCPVISTVTGDVERQTENTPRILIELPVRRHTDLNPGNIGMYLYEPNRDLIEKLSAALETAAQGSLPRSSRRIPDRSAVEVYSGYLRAFNLIGSGFAPQAVRHNIERAVKP